MVKHQFIYHVKDRLWKVLTIKYSLAVPSGINVSFTLFNFIIAVHLNKYIQYFIIV